MNEIRTGRLIGVEQGYVVMLSTIRVSRATSLPEILTRLWRDVSPAMISTADFGTSNNSARNTRQSLLAAPSTGGEVSRIFRA